MSSGPSPERDVSVADRAVEARHCGPPAPSGSTEKHHSEQVRLAEASEPDQALDAKIVIVL